MPLGNFLIQMHADTRSTIKWVWAKKLAIPFVGIRHFQFDTERVKLVSGDFNPVHRTMPLYKTAIKIVVAFENPFVTDLLVALTKVNNLRFELSIASHEDVDYLVQKFFAQ